MPHVVSSPVRLKFGKTTSLRQLLEIQQRVYETSIDEKVRPGDLAQLARAWEVLEDRKRIIRGRPLPGSLKPVPPKREPRNVEPEVIE